MSVIEFVGIPCSGKTKFYIRLKKILEKKFKIYNFSDLFYIFSEQLINLSILEKISLRIDYIIYKKNLSSSYHYKLNSSNKNSSVISFLKLMIKKYVKKKIENIKEKIINSFSKKEKKLLYILNKSLRKSPLNKKQKIVLESRIIKEIIGYHIYNNISMAESIILNDEGLYQRILSGIGKLNNKDIKRIFLNILFFKKHDTDTIILFLQSPLKKIKLRAKKRKQGFNFKDFKDIEIKKWLEVFNKFHNNYDKKKIYLVKDENLLEISKKIIRFS